jgi:hypothetical protein
VAYILMIVHDAFIFARRVGGDGSFHLALIISSEVAFSKGGQSVMSGSSFAKRVEELEDVERCRRVPLPAQQST